MQREMDMEAEEEADDENLDEVVPVMGTGDDWLLPKSMHRIQ